MVRLGVTEISSIPKAYGFLDKLTKQGFEALDFSPHANGVRILFRLPEKHEEEVSSETEVLSVSVNVLKAMLSKTNNAVKNLIVVVESKKITDILKLANAFEKNGASILEVRGLRSNSHKNYGLFSVDSEANCPTSLKNFEHTILSSQNLSLIDFLGLKKI